MRVRLGVLAVVCGLVAAFAVLPASAVSLHSARGCPSNQNQRGANAPGADYSKCDLSHFDFSNANLAGANLNQATLVGATLDGANLEGANLNKANFSNGSAVGADFKNANLNQATLDGSDFTRANVKGANSNKASCQGALVWQLVGTLACSGTVSVPPDTTPPTLNLPANLTAEATSAAGAAVAFSVSATDNVDAAPVVLCDHATGATFPLGSTTVSCSATDAAGNTSTGSFTVTVNDTTPPSVTVPADITTTAASPVVTFSASASDLVDGSTPTTCTPASGSTFALGTTTVNCSSTDAHGNTGSGSFTVTVNAAPQTITFTSSAPVWPAIAGATYTPAATATSGLPVAFTIDSSGASACAISPNTGAINFIGLGTCTVQADQAGDDAWEAAPQATQTFQVSVENVSVVVNADSDPQMPPLPPNPNSNTCDPQNVLGGGCFLNPLDGSSENIFDASATVASSDPGFDPSLYDIQYHWQMFKPPGLGSAPYSSNGMTGYHAAIFDIQLDSLPELLGTDAGQDFYWRLELTVDINGVEEIGWMKFQYQSSTLSLKLSTTCQLTGQSQTTQCQFAAPNGLPATEPT